MSSSQLHQPLGTRPGSLCRYWRLLLERCERKTLLASWWLLLEWCERKTLLASWRLLEQKTLLAGWSRTGSAKGANSMAPEHKCMISSAFTTEQKAGNDQSH